MHLDQNTWKTQVGMFEFMMNFSIQGAVLHNFSILIKSMKITDKNTKVTLDSRF